MRWYVSQNGRTSGPFSEERITMLLRWGKLSRSAYICDEQWSTWVAITRSAFAPLLNPPGGSSSGPGSRDSLPAPHLLAGLHRFVFAGLFLVAAALTVAGGVYRQRGIVGADGPLCADSSVPASDCRYPGGTPDPFGFWP
jgi:hypothetical protein